MKPDYIKFLEDINASIDLINIYTADLVTVYDYEKDIETTDAVERRLGIIGEALMKAIKVEPSLNISDKARIVKLRHILVHDYNLITNATIWTIIKKDLVKLKEEVALILNDTNG